MTNETLNDNHAVSSELLGPDSHGQAALLLVEGLIHALIARSVISVAEAVEIVEVAAEVKTEIAEELGDSPAKLRQSLTLLRCIRKSLRHDILRE